MDHWNLAIDRNRKALVAIAASLSGLVCSPRNRRYVSRVLRAAEAALRRLIVMYMKAHNIAAPAPKPGNRPLPDFSSFGSGSNKRTPVFNLFDPRKSLVMLDGEMVDFSSASPSGSRTSLVGASLTLAATEEGCHDQTGRADLAGVPRVHFIGSADWYSIPSVAEQALRVSAAQFVNRWLADKPQATSRDGRWDGCPDEDKQSEQETKSSQKLLNRLAALNHALKTLPHQARRLARIMARRKDAKPGPGAIPPIRPGIPPGLRRSKREKIDDILSECHGLMRDMELPPI